MNYSLMHPRDEIVLTMERIYRYKMTTTSGGNISILDDGHAMWITPGAVDKGSLRPDDIVCVQADGRVAGRHKPSSECPFHQAIYHARPDIRAIVHAHPVALVAFSASGRVPDTRLFPQAHRVCGDVGFAPYAPPGTQQLGENIARTFAKGFKCVVLENHGVVTGAPTLQEAFQEFETLEFTAKTFIKASIVGRPRPLSEEQIELAHRTEPHLPEFEPGPPTNGERELRKGICDFVVRGYKQGLVTSTTGSFSARVDDRSFLITPYPVDRYSIEPADLTLVRDGKHERGKTPSRAVLNHKAIYDRHPQVGAIVNAFPVNASAFSVCETPLNTHTIPESYVLLRDVPRLPYGIQYEDGRALAERVSIQHPVALFENDGVLVLGKTVLSAFDRLEVLEYTAEAVINSQPIGGTKPMSEELLRELERMFPEP